MNRMLDPLHSMLLLAIGLVAIVYALSLTQTRHVVDLLIPALPCDGYPDTCASLRISRSGWLTFEQRIRSRDSVLSSQTLRLEQLPEALTGYFDRRVNKLLYVHADSGVGYGDMIRTVDVARRAGPKIFALANSAETCDTRCIVIVP